MIGGDTDESEGNVVSNVVANEISPMAIVLKVALMVSAVDTFENRNTSNMKAIKQRSTIANIHKHP